jgi:hypothetical protein
LLIRSSGQECRIETSQDLSTQNPEYHAGSEGSEVSLHHYLSERENAIRNLPLPTACKQAILYSLICVSSASDLLQVLLQFLGPQQLHGFREDTLKQSHRNMEAYAIFIMILSLKHSFF